jgi:hypothetical protein
MREIQDGINVPIVKLTNLPFDQVIGHNNGERKYFTVENNDIIYGRFKNELRMKGCGYPYLGPCVDFGLGDLCIEEDGDIFKFYVIDRGDKFGYKEFNDVRDAIQELISKYREYDLVDDLDKMEEIFYTTLGLEKKDNKTK